MEQENQNMEKIMRRSRIGSGLFLIIGGLLFLAFKMGAPLPAWLFTWPCLLIAIGLLTGLKSSFRNPGAFILILIGGVFLANQIIPGINISMYIFPIIMIGLGIVILIRPRHHSFGRYQHHRPFGRHRRGQWGGPLFDDNETVEHLKSFKSNEEYIDVHAVLGGVKKNIQSKSFKGGEIVCFMGGAEINLMQADIQGTIVLEVNNVFGGTKLIIPGNWEVQIKISATFGGVEDKRTFQNNIPDQDKKIILKGSCLFGGVEIANY